MMDLTLAIQWCLTRFGTIVAVLAGWAFAYYLWYTYTFTSKLKSIPIMKTYPVLTYIQTLWQAYREKYPRAAILRLMCAICKACEKERIAMIWIFLRPFVIFFKPETIEMLLNNSVTISKATEYDYLKSWLGTGLLTSDGSKWRAHRKLLTQAFHFDILENFLYSFNEQASILTKKLETKVGKAWIDIRPVITMCTLDIICETAMGVHLNTQTEQESCMKYVNGIEQASEVFVYRVLRPWLWLDLVFHYISPSGREQMRNIKMLQDFTKKVIKEKKESMLRKTPAEEIEQMAKKRKKKAFLELLLEHHLKDETFTEENIREEVDTFMFEGHDTTAMAISWALYELGRNPGLQEKVFYELDGIFGGDVEREVTSEDLKQMKYLECVIKETLRLYPSVAFIGRKLNQDLKINDNTLSPGCTCFVCIIMLHMDPEQFPLPHKFDPDRFLPENSSKRHPYSYIPFSAGPRNCIGQRFALMEEKTVLSHILRKFRVTSLDPRDKLVLLAGLILRSAKPVRIKFSLRSSDYSVNPD